LWLAVRKVFDSWDTEKAVTFRQIMGISNDWGTAVTVQEMVFGNLSGHSGTGVVFTHNPRWPSDTIHLWGDYTTGNQGEDIVSGLVKTLPISIRQAEMENRDTEAALERLYPNIYTAIRNFAKRLIYEEKWAPQEMEFTFEDPSEEAFYFLQTRDMTIREVKKVLSFIKKPGIRVPPVGHGIGVSGGAMTGRVVYNMEEVRHWREKEPETSLILIRNDTVPDDIREIYATDGLLTARGGSTSHAAIVAHRLGKTCVVGCADLVCMEKEGRCILNRMSFRAGDMISLDGREGSVYSGMLEVEETERRE
jgi:pyruvate,orthophosphate dikinase